MALTAEGARAVLAQAISDESIEGPIPEDDATAIGEAEELVAQAAEAWDQNVRGAQVEAILRVAAAHDEEMEDDESDDVDDDDADDVEDSVEDSVDDEDDEEDLSEIEPWEGYDDEKVTDIKAALEYSRENDTEEEFLSLASHVYQYEDAKTKPRGGILNLLDKLAKEIQSEEASEEEEEQPEAASESDESLEGEVESGDDDGYEDGESDSETAEVAGGVGDAYAGIDAGHEAGEQGEEGGTDAEPTPKARKKRSTAKSVAADVTNQEEDEYVTLMRAVEATTAEESLYVPPKIEVDQPEVPDDWTTLTGEQVQNLYGAFATFAQRAAYLEKIESGRAKICKTAADEIADYLFSQEKIGKDATVTHVKARIESDPDVSRWRKRQRKHEAFAHSHKMDRERFRDMVEAFSRIHSMRKDEWEMSGGKNGTPNAIPRRAVRK